MDIKNIFRGILLGIIIVTAFITGLGLIFIITLLLCALLLITSFINYFKKNKSAKKDNKYIDAEYEIIEEE